MDIWRNIMIKKIYFIELKKYKTGYFYRNKMVSLVRVYHTGMYFMQVKSMCFEKCFEIYQSKKKPRFRNLNLIAILFFIPVLIYDLFLILIYLPFAFLGIVNEFVFEYSIHTKHGILFQLLFLFLMVAGLFKFYDFAVLVFG